METEKDFSRYGRVNYVLAKRLDLLVEVEKLQKSLNVCGDVAYTCETSGFFFVHHVLPNWERFLIKVKAANASVVSRNTRTQVVLHSLLSLLTSILMH